LLLVLWVNLHGSWVMAPIIAGAFALEALIASSDRLHTLRQWAAFGLACAVAIGLNANGLEGVLYPLRVANLAMLPLINEWQPPTLRSTPLFFAVLLAVAALVLLKRPRLSPARWLLVGALLVLSLMQMRHEAVFAIVAAMVLPEGFAARRDTRDIEPRLAWLTALAAAAFVAIRAIIPLALPENAANPWRLSPPCRRRCAPSRCSTAIRWAGR
jgi:hypothetical protein